MRILWVILGLCFSSFFSGIATAQCPAVPTTGNTAARLTALTKTVNCLRGQNSDPDAVYVDTVKQSVSGSNATPATKTYTTVIAVLANGPSTVMNGTIVVGLPGSEITTGSCVVQVKTNSYTPFCSTTRDILLYVLFKK
jgi:hypothetical protein